MRVLKIRRYHQLPLTFIMDIFSFVLYFFGLHQANCCTLVPNSSCSSSCLNLTATPFITSNTSQFGRYIEGASTNPKGQMFAVNYGDNTSNYKLGQFYPQQNLFYSDANNTSFLNGIRFLNDNVAYTVDAVNHRVLQLKVTTQGPLSTVVSSTVFCQNSSMLQPNDLTLSKKGTVFTSGMKWISDTNNTHGDIWSCRQDGTVQQLEVMGRTNGIELSPDEKHLYVSESYNAGGLPYIQKIWVYNADVIQGTISGKRLFADFGALDGTGNVDIDGMKTDVNGNLYVTRHGGQEVVVFNPSGDVIGRIRLNFSRPTNLEFGGEKGTTLFVVGKCEDKDVGCVDKIEVATPGRSWTNLQTTRKTHH